MDIIIGLYKPILGSFYGIARTNLNLRPWYKNTGYVPQNIQLFDNSIKMNIAFGVEKKKLILIEFLNV